MKALENRTIFSSCQHDREKLLQIHRERLKCIRNVIDTRRVSTPNTTARCSSPSKKAMTKQANHERIVKDNLLLAHKIFNIMEGNSDITDKINDQRHIDNHPGTMNFKARLAEAKRVHERNMLLASRLDTVQPYYKIADLRVIRPTKKRVATSHNAKKSKFARELGMVLKADRHVDGFGELTHRSAGHADSFGHNTRLPTIDPEMHSQSARKADYGQEPESRGDNQRGRPNNVLLEYTKIQEGRVLDVAVLKEPFRDRYAIFGIDVDDGQRYELRITSEEVSSILDGDMLVTSVDNVEVWMALLNKVTLQKVGFFARLPFSSDDVDNASGTSNNNSSSRGASPPKSAAASPRGEEEIAARYALNFTTSPALVPSAPTISRPSTERPASRSNTAGAGNTSAAGAIRSRHLKSAGGGNTGSSANGRGAGSRPARSANEAPAAVDPILSLFADAGLVDDFARTQIATPGFLDNATSATVTLVEVNADFPDAPPETDVSKFFENEATEGPPADDSPRSKNTKKSSSSQQQRSNLKSGGGARSNAQRAAAVRRRSIENEQVKNAKPTAGAAASAAVSDAQSTSTQPRKPAAPGESKAPANRPSVHKHAPAVTAATATKNATVTPAPALVPKPPGGAKPSSAVPAETATGAPVSASAKAGPSSSTKSPKAPAAAPTSSSARPGSKPGSARPVNPGTVSAKATTSTAPAAAQSPPLTQDNATPVVDVAEITPTATPAVVTAQEQTKEMAMSCVSSAVDLAMASVVRSRSNLSLPQQSSAKHASAKEGASEIDATSGTVDVKGNGTEELSTVLNEPSQVINKSVVGEASVSQGYSTDFEAAASS
eukprot:gene13924-16011_t